MDVEWSLDFLFLSFFQLDWGFDLTLKILKNTIALFASLLIN